MKTENKNTNVSNETDSPAFLVGAVIGSLPLLINGLNVEALSNILYNKWALHYEGRVMMTRDLFTLAIQDIVRGNDR